MPFPCAFPIPEIGPTGPAGPTGPTGSISLSYISVAAYFSQTVDPNADVVFNIIGATNNATFTVPSTITIGAAGDYEYEYGLVIQGPSVAAYTITIGGVPDIITPIYGSIQTSGDAQMLVGQGIRSFAAGDPITLRNVGTTSNVLIAHIDSALTNCAYLILKRVGP
ncbi:hypothetical protein AB1283_10750 [Bacillus sp. S13(2024)]|uniref:hypothetical protein n=1 Tax=unclassified Bacillus (in: firmicutes) TaxID=185979 RepID=UPI003D23F3A7